MMLITGARGFVGHKLMEFYPDSIAAPSLRNKSQEEIDRLVEESGAEIIVNTAAISDIPTCAANPEASYAANVLLPVMLARASRGRKLICFSSDQVYSGLEERGPYPEAAVRPGNLYAAHKWEMEQRVLDLNPDAVLLRAEWMYDLYPQRENYFMKILHAERELAFSSREFRGVTYLREVAENMEKAAKLPGGAYNFGSETTKSMYEITLEFLAAIGKDLPLVDTGREHSLWVDCSKAKAYGIKFSSVSDALLRCARDYNLLES